MNVQRVVFSQQTSAEKSVLERSELILILRLLMSVSQETSTSPPYCQIYSVIYLSIVGQVWIGISGSVLWNRKTSIFECLEDRLKAKLAC